MIPLVFAALLAMASLTPPAEPCAGCGILELRLSTKKLARRGEVNVVLTDPSGQAHTSPVPRGQSDVRIEIPRGTYDLVVHGPRAIRIRRQVVIGEAPVKMAFVLEPLPKLTGTVLARTTRRPVAGALVDAGDHPAITDAAGRFELDADPELWPARIRVRAIPFAETSVPIPPARVSAVLPDIYVTHGGTVAVEVAQQREGEVTELELREIEQSETAGDIVNTLPVPSAIQAGTLRFENVEPGRYVVVAKGDEELMRFGAVVEVTEGQDVSVPIAISPYTLDVRTRMEGEKLPNAEIALTHFDGRWEGTLHTDGEGSARVQLWQGGKVRSMLDAPGLTAPHIERHRLAPVDDEWVLDIDALEIEGVVVDARNGAPIARARLRLHVDAQDGFSLATGTVADSEGRFHFRPVHHGKHQLRIAAADYQPRAMSYLFLEPERNRDLAIRLDRSVTVQLKLLDAAGAPVPMATALHLQDGIPMRGHTDAAGMLSVPVATDRPTDLYIIPADGSLAVTTLTPEARETVVRVPPAIGRLVVRTETTSHDPIANVSVLVRYNGRVLPPDVLHALVQTNGGGVRTDAGGRLIFNRMPGGLYELWPVASDQEMRALAAGAGGDPAVRIAVAPGDNVVVMTFEPATRR
jgi:Carboxypeptidase regulatory-like domain